MALNCDDKAHIRAIWPCLASHAEQYGAEALHRMFLCHPQTKTYFPNFDFHANSAHLKNHGKKVMNALTDAVKHLDHPEASLSSLSDLHAFTLRVDPGNFALLSNNILVVVAVHHSDKLSYETHQALDKFLNVVSGLLTSKYR
ncbi:Hemoglobin subunit alpha-C [Aquarana catesbeiana]|uniref:Hemoglobin subunit alpha-C n=2 Tax=Aquarana catesbeiana TaxID=8400 RepID=HBAC_AQUCT|nr:RecName: Full=Hemoglobin subunit alpha-C; AltName: Full=Alpha-C-globin; AltName: Full=Hemoglobin alpha-C chain [Aquarana catesbeiana]PIO26168.1 Hemoglobin subunit alpha-C [Aquarana catesbeiana]